MERLALIEEVYSELCKKFLREVPQEKHTEFQTAYLQFLHSKYDRHFEEAAADELNNVACFCVKTEKLLRDNMSLNDKTAMLFPDEKYIEFENLCLEISAIARSVLLGQDVKISSTYEQYKKMLNERYDKVSELFKYTAGKLLSDALVDLECIFNDSQKRSFKNSVF